MSSMSNMSGKGCPFCSGATAVVANPDNGGVCVQCDVCGARGPAWPSATEASAVWLRSYGSDREGWPDAAMFKYGASVEKFIGEARWEGAIVSAYETTAGKLRYVVEVTPQGFQMIAVPEQLRATEGGATVFEFARKRYERTGEYRSGFSKPRQVIRSLGPADPPRPRRGHG